MSFRTELNIQPSLCRITHGDQIMTIGSCFSQHIGDKLQKYKLNCISNPFGTVFNPISISSLLIRAITNTPVKADEFFQTQGLWHHFDFHSSFSHAEKQAAKDGINTQIEFVHNRLNQLKCIFITLGTSIVYEHTTTQYIVANCHKMAASTFRKRNLTTQESTGALLQAIRSLQRINPNIHVIFTVSPVRHIKDGLIENTKSKAALHLAVADVMEQMANTHYFPAWEWVMDDLRDYRFYEPDMIHPNSTAVEYIWNKFTAHFCDDDTIILMSAWEKILDAKNHRPFNPESVEHINFCKKYIELIAKLKEKYPHIDMREEEEWFGRYI